jgi:hypothetical protein
MAAVLATEILDLASLPLSEIRTMRGSVLEDAVGRLTAKVRNGECVESIQSQRD